MRRLVVSSMAAALLSLVIAAPVLAWRVETEPGSAKPTARSIDPRGDPWARVIARNAGRCFGSVIVPVARWSVGTVFTVTGTGKSGRPGEPIRLRCGSYSGTWSNSDEVEHFTIRDVTPTARVTWSFVRKQTGKRVWLRIDVPRGCVYRSPWRSVLGSTEMRMWDRENREVMFRKQMAKPGQYAPLWRGYRKGLTCPVLTPAQP